MGSAWLDHVKNEMKKHPGLKLKEVLKIAAKTYKKGSSPSASGSKRKTRKHKKHHKKYYATGCN